MTEQYQYTLQGGSPIDLKMLYIVDSVHEALAMLEGGEFDDEYDEQDDL